MLAGTRGVIDQAPKPKSTAAAKKLGQQKLRSPEARSKFKKAIGKLGAIPRNTRASERGHLIAKQVAKAANACYGASSFAQLSATYVWGR